MKGYLWAVGAALACTLAGILMRARFDLVNIAMIYLLAVVLVAERHSRGPAIAATVLSVAAFDVVFVPPQGGFSVDDLQYLLTFAIMLAVGLVISRLADSVRAQSAAQANLQAAAETERVRSMLLASISHDLRTPLAVMSGASSSLVEGGERMSPDERRALARSLYQQAHDMSERVAKLLQMTRLEIGGIKLQREWDSIANVAGASLARLRERMARHRVVLELSDDLPLVRVDAALIDQALSNLLENAAIHTPPDTVIRLRAWRAEQAIVVSVEDYGPGVPKGDEDRIFAKFEHGTAEGRPGGVGLGLAIARAIVVLHGGRAWAERLPMGGSAFRFTLPIEAQPALPAEAPA